MEKTPLPEEQDGRQIQAIVCQFPVDHHSLPENLVQSLLSSTNSKTLEDTLESLLQASKSAHGRSNLASTKTLSHLLLLLPHSLSQNPLLFSLLKILRNLCAGEISNQTSFIESNGVEIVHVALRSYGFDTQPSDLDVVRIGLQLLGNVALAGEEHCAAVWNRFFPLGFGELASVRSSEVCDPLCMILCVCCERSDRLFEEICGDDGLRIVAEILRTASMVGSHENWLPLLVSRICFQERYFSQLFLELSLINSSKNSSGLTCGDTLFTKEQAFLLSLLSEILNQQTIGIVVYNGFVLAIFEILKTASGTVESFSRGHSSLPTGCPTIDVLGYSLNILRDICAHDSTNDQSEPSSISIVGGFETEASTSIVDSLVCLGLVTLLICLLRELDPPEIIRKSSAPEENRGKVCPYLGYRRDIVAVIGNCTFRRKQVQDEIRKQNGILLLMQQCVVDKDNPFLREWGYWAMRNLLEGNTENQRQVSELELQGSIDTPDIAALGLRVEIDQKSQRPKLVNVS